MKVEVRFDINVQRQTFLNDSVTIVEEFEKSVRNVKIDRLFNFKCKLWFYIEIKFDSYFFIFLITMLKYCILVKCFLRRGKCRRIPLGESFICSVSNENSSSFSER